MLPPRIAKELGYKGPSQGKQNPALSSVSPLASGVVKALLVKVHLISEGTNNLHNKKAGKTLFCFLFFFYFSFYFIFAQPVMFMYVFIPVLINNSLQTFGCFQARISKSSILVIEYYCNYLNIHY